MGRRRRRLEGVGRATRPADFASAATAATTGTATSAAANAASRLRRAIRWSRAAARTWTRAGDRRQQHEQRGERDGTLLGDRRRARREAPPGPRVRARFPPELEPSSARPRRRRAGRRRARRPHGRTSGADVGRQYRPGPPPARPTASVREAERRTRPRSGGRARRGSPCRSRSRSAQRGGFPSSTLASPDASEQCDAPEHPLGRAGPGGRGRRAGDAGCREPCAGRRGSTRTDGSTTGSRRPPTGPARPALRPMSTSAAARGRPTPRAIRTARRRRGRHCSSPQAGGA